MSLKARVRERLSSIRGNSIRGSVDGIFGGDVCGWASDGSNRRLRIAVQLDGHDVARGIADLHRPDLVDAGVGDGRHAFALAAPIDLTPKPGMTVDILDIETGDRLRRRLSRKRFNQTLGSLYPSTDGVIRGWVYLPWQPNVRPTLELRRGSQILETTIPRHFVAALLGSGGGRFGFAFSTQADVPGPLTVRCVETGWEQPIQVSRDGAVLEDSATVDLRSLAANDARRRTMSDRERSASDTREERETSAAGKRALVVDVGVPDPNTNAGGYAALTEIRLLQALGYAIDFITPDGVDQSEKASTLASIGVNVLLRDEFDNAQAALEKIGQTFDLVYVTRYDVAAAIFDAVRQFAPSAAFVVNVADLHYLRESRRAEIEGSSEVTAFAMRVKADELRVLSRADLVLTYSIYEAELLENALGSRVNVAICPWVETTEALVPRFAERSDISFLGGFTHTPNVDAMVWFADEVMPLIRKEVPGVRLHIYGSHTPQVVRDCSAADVIVHGFVQDLRSVYDPHLVFIAPLRYGAGFKGKVAGAMARGVPTVLSPVAAEGLLAPEDHAGILADEPAQWVAAIKLLTSSEEAWNAASAAALDHARREFDFEAAVARFDSALQRIG